MSRPYGGVPVKLAEIVTLTVTVRLSDVSVIRQEPVAEPVFSPATSVHENAVVAVDAFVGLQLDIPLTPETDHA
jgi:hypothetical protein